jgi:hypothetical protein
LEFQRDKTALVLLLHVTKNMEEKKSEKGKKYLNADRHFAPQMTFRTSAGTTETYKKMAHVWNFETKKT